MTLDLALSYTARGWPVFPCRSHETVDEHGEVHAEKTPLTARGFRDASRAVHVVRRFWGENPDALVGIPTGEKIGAWVLDVDVKTLDNGAVIDGHASFAALTATYGPLPRTATVTTPRGGRHYYFKHVQGMRNTADKAGPGLDSRGEGGFVIAAGSVMADGRAYEWYDGTGPDEEGGLYIADAPGWLIDLLMPKVAPVVTTPYVHQGGKNEPYVDAAMEQELTALASLSTGRGAALNRAAFSLGTLVGAGALSRADAEDGLYNAARSNGGLAKDGERETRAKIKRGLDSGIRQPRAVPDAPVDDTPLVNVTALTRPKKKAAVATQENFSVASAPPAGDSNTSDEKPPQVLKSPEAERPAIIATPYAFKDPRTLPRREFAYGTHYIRKYVSVTVSPGGLGKTSNSIVEALSMASGRDLTGTKPPSRMRCWLFNAEDPRDELERRIQAACLWYKLGPDDINGQLFLDTGREQDLVVAVDDKKAGTRIQVPIVKAVVDQITANRIDVMIVDPFVSTHQVNENDNGAIDKVAKLWAQIADETNCSIDIVHHLRKVADREATVEDARGAVSLIGAARSVRVLNRMSEEEATAASVPEADRFSYFKIHQGKANLTKMSSASEWRKLESQPLGNGRGLQSPQDFAGVVTQWHWPTAEEVAQEILQEVSADQLEAIKIALDNSEYKFASNAKNWAGCAVAFALGLDIEEKAVRRRVGSLLKVWIADGTLVVREEKDMVTRHIVKVVRSR